MNKLATEPNSADAIELTSLQVPEKEPAPTPAQKPDQNPDTAQDKKIPNPPESDVPPPSDKELFLPPDLTGDAPEVQTGRELHLDAVINSVYQSYPKLQSALFERNVANGNYLAAWGEFDTKLKGASETGNFGFYETYRNNIGVVQPLFGGSDVFAGYRIGRGDFQPWYKERQTDDGGEFKAGITVPLAQDRTIDARRTDVWTSSIQREFVEPEIQAQLIAFVEQASFAYWEWVAAGRQLRIVEAVLRIADDRNDRIRRQVEEGFLDPPEYTDNLRLMADRRAKQASALRKVREKAIKLSLYYRDFNGQPIVPDIEQLPVFPEVKEIDAQDLDTDIQIALQNRPELRVFDFIRKQLDVEHAQASNLMKPEVDAVFVASDDVGAPASSKRDKSRFEFDAGLYVSVPIQRRKAIGKMQSIEGKVSQVLAKRRYASDQIAAEVKSAYVALEQSRVQVIQAREAVRLAVDLARREARNEELGLSDMLKVSLREQYAQEAADKEVAALLTYFEAEAAYRAALAIDRL
ncbi:TolC family protein [Thalassoglobus neptunius]|uniref:TolC family protein n=1 Tax=Thalassoglobus neptunius TaxID=1938619 RepID=UPI0018D26E4F|nr:TolC family protein [Thalassoglobus neptunius]